ncbi:tetratricopeptide repeat-containing protein [Cardiosporidium cionae]|uniref:Tetratricopeptide repeat-containing protein n=1 Tax=Cardiosporidium cionae TaxID=476202 RepID=A0ABQ7JF23_9APIC|nr:tetratricopeptide repeat-containing protein [Cardiosporidium cionae]|eukprot:KAF8822479.1 tetratricopeptide repeat-containing protein [Cardiosporidium cionae]
MTIVTHCIDNPSGTNVMLSIDKEPDGSHRLLYFHQLNYPARWEAQRELGMRMLRIGAFLSAFNMFKAMLMWEEAIDCLIAADRLADAKILLEERLSIRPTPPLWCSKGDLEKECSCYEKAWQLSGCRYARAQRSIGHFALKSNNFDAAIVAYRKALKINPLHAHCWFNLGCCLMQENEWFESLESFAKVVMLEPDHGEAWANMAGIHSKNASWEEAKVCVEQAVKYCNENWKVWDTYLKVGVRMRDIPAVIRGIRVIIDDLHQKKMLPTWIFAFLVDIVISNASTNSATKTGQDYYAACIDIISVASNHFADKPEIWDCYSTLLEYNGCYELAFEMYLREFRILQTEIFSSDIVKEILSGRIELLGVTIQKLFKCSTCFKISKESFEGLKLTLKALTKRIDQHYPGKFGSAVELIKETVHKLESDEFNDKK